MSEGKPAPSVPRAGGSNVISIVVQLQQRHLERLRERQPHGLANCRPSLALDPTEIDVLHTAAKLHASRGEHAEAVAAYDGAIALAPEYADFYHGRAESLMALGNFGAALDDFDRIIELDPSRGEPR